MLFITLFCPALHIYFMHAVYLARASDGSRHGSWQCVGAYNRNVQTLVALSWDLGPLCVLSCCVHSRVEFGLLGQINCFVSVVTVLGNIVCAEGREGAYLQDRFSNIP